jgi:hypothetical protein
MNPRIVPFQNENMASRHTVASHELRCAPVVLVAIVAIADVQLSTAADLFDGLP